jgi:hypothetical protein
LGTKRLSKSARDVGEQLVKGYKDHSFVIGKEEARNLLSATIVCSDTPEYELADRVYKLIEDVKLAIFSVTKDIYDLNYVGNNVLFEKMI